MKKILIYGADSTTATVLRMMFADSRSIPEYGIMGFIDTDKARAKSTFLGQPVFSLADVRNMQFDKIIVIKFGNDYGFIFDMLAYEYGFGEDKVVNPNYLIFAKIIGDHENGKRDYSDDPEMEQTVRQIEAAECFDVWCGYCPKPEEKYEIHWDDEFNFPYVMFEGKRMYYPRSYQKHAQVSVEDGKQYMSGIEFEQQEGSPHTYITDDIYIKEGDVVVDAGVREGNFAIKYIDKVSKLYLIECDPVWLDPLTLTFRDHLDKVVFCTKFLGNANDEKTITLDKLIGNGRVDFVKMDIEGAETDALKGAEKVFRNNDIRCSICSYHKHDDEKNIRSILESYGYDTSTSHGHMIFHLDSERFIWSEPRHGIVYGKKN